MRVFLILKLLRKYVTDIESLKGLGFCVSKEHAEYMSRKFNEAGIASECPTRELRKELASKDGVPPFVVFTDEQLASIVKQKPENLGKLTAIQGIGQLKAEKYGNSVIQIINEACNKTV